MELRFKLASRPLVLRVERIESGCRAGLADRPLEIDGSTIGERFITIRSGGRELKLLYEVAAGHIHVSWRGETYEFVPAELDDDETVGAVGRFTPEVTAPMPGKVLDVLVGTGEAVAADQPLLLLEAMKMEQTVRAPAPARVVEIRVDSGAMVGPGEVLLVLSQVDGGEPPPGRDG